MEGETLEAYLDWLEVEKRPSGHTARVYGRVATRILESGLDPADWLEDVLEVGSPRGTVQTYLAAATAYWSWLVSSGVQAGPPPNRRVASEELPPPEGLGEEELRDYLDLVSGMDEPHRTILGLLPRTGLRISEACGLRIDQIQRDLPTGWALRFAGKGAGGAGRGGGKIRWVPLSRTARDVVERWLDVRAGLYDPTSTWLFPSPVDAERHFTADAVRAAWRQVRQELGEHVTPHVLRHTFAHRFLERHGYEALPALQRILGHASLETTRRYAKDSARHLAALVESMDDHEESQAEGLDVGLVEAPDL